MSFDLVKDAKKEKIFLGKTGSHSNLTVALQQFSSEMSHYVVVVVHHDTKWLTRDQ